MTVVEGRNRRDGRTVHRSFWSLGPLDDTNATRERAETRDGRLLCLVKPKRVDEIGEVLCDCLVGVDGQQTEEVVA